MNSAYKKQMADAEKKGYSYVSGFVPCHLQ